MSIEQLLIDRVVEKLDAIGIIIEGRNDPGFITVWHKSTRLFSFLNSADGRDRLYWVLRGMETILDQKYVKIHIKYTYQVLDNDKPADENGFPELKGRRWTSAIFKTFEEAQTYARNWLGLHYQHNCPSIPNFKVDYSGHGDFIEIRQISLCE